MENKPGTVQPEVLEEVIKYLEQIVLPSRHRIIELFEKRERIHATSPKNKN